MFLLVPAHPGSFRQRAAVKTVVYVCSLLTELYWPHHRVCFPVWAPGHSALDSIFDFGAIYIVCLFILCSSPLTVFFLLFSYSSPPLLVFLRLQCFDAVSRATGRASGL